MAGLTRREAMKLAAAGGAAVLGDPAAADENEDKPKKKTQETMPIKFVLYLQPGLTTKWPDGNPHRPSLRPEKFEFTADVLGEKLQFKGPLHGAVVSFGWQNLNYVAAEIWEQHVYIRAVYNDEKMKPKEYATYC